MEKIVHKHLISHIKDFTNDCRGSVYVWIAGGLLATLGLAGLAVDMSYFYVLRNQLQTSADSAALAGAKLMSNEGQMRAEAKKYAQMNVPNDTDILVDSDIVPGTWDPDARVFTAGGGAPNAVRVTTRMSQQNGNAAETFFARVLGFDDVDISTTAVAAYASGDEWDVLVVQDVTGSFDAEIADARDANHALLDCLQQRTSGDSLVGMVTFTGVAQDYIGLDTLENGYDSMSTAIDGLDSCDHPGMPACSGTHVGAGIARGIELFDATPGTPEIGRAMVILGDGAPTASGPNAGMSVQDLKDQAMAYADDAEARGISVFTVFYDQDDDDDAAEFFEDLVRGDGKAMRTPDPAQLPELFENVCAQMPLKLVL